MRPCAKASFNDFLACQATTRQCESCTPQSLTFDVARRIYFTSPHSQAPFRFTIPLYYQTLSIRSSQLDPLDGPSTAFLSTLRSPGEHLNRSVIYSDSTWLFTIMSCNNSTRSQDGMNRGSRVSRKATRFTVQVCEANDISLLSNTTLGMDTRAERQTHYQLVSKSNHHKSKPKMPLTTKSKKFDRYVERGARRGREVYIEIDEVTSYWKEYDRDFNEDPMCCWSCRARLDTENNGAYYDDECNLHWEDGYEVDSSELFHGMKLESVRPILANLFSLAYFYRRGHNSPLTDPSTGSTPPVLTPTSDMSTASPCTRGTPTTDTDIDSGWLLSAENNSPTNASMNLSWELLDSSALVFDRRSNSGSFSSDLESMSDIDQAALEGIGSFSSDERTSSWWWDDDQD